MVCVEPLEYKRNARRGILAIIGALAFVAVCVAMIVASGLASFLGILGLVGAVFFGLVAVAGVRTMGAGKVALRLTDQGFEDFTSATSLRGRTIPWSEVQSIAAGKFERQDFVTVYLKETDFFLSSLDGPGAAAARFNLNRGFGAITILPAAVKGAKAQEIAETMNSYLAASRR